MLIVAFSGKLGSGKDFFAEKLSKLLTQNKISNVSMNFADQLKIQAMINFEQSFEDVFIQKTTESRKFLQGYGVECREKHGENIWIEYLDVKTKICEMRGTQVFILSDMRFLNEFLYMKGKGAILVRVVSEERNLQKLREETNNNEEAIAKIKTHISETDLDSIPDSSFDVIIDNNDIISNKFNIKTKFNDICEFIQSKSEL